MPARSGPRQVAAGIEASARGSTEPPQGPESTLRSREAQSFRTLLPMRRDAAKSAASLGRARKGAGAANRDAPVAQLDRAPDYESGGQRFESFRARQSSLQLSMNRREPACTLVQPGDVSAAIRASGRSVSGAAWLPLGYKFKKRAAATDSRMQHFRRSTVRPTFPAPPCRSHSAPRGIELLFAGFCGLGNTSGFTRFFQYNPQVWCYFPAIRDCQGI